MQVQLFILFLQAFEFVFCQMWNDSNGGIVVKTLYLPLRKGSSSVSLQELNSARHLTTLNIPFLPSNQHTEIQQTSLPNQNYHPKVKQSDSIVHQFQDVRQKVNSYPKPDAAQLQASNYYSPYHGPASHQQQYNSVQLQSNSYSADQSIETPTNQHDSSYQYMNQPAPPNAVQQNNYPNHQHSTDSVSTHIQTSPTKYAENLNKKAHNNVNLPAYVYPSHGIVAKNNPAVNSQLYPVQNSPQSQSHSYAVQNSPQSQSHSYAVQNSHQSGSTQNQEAVTISQKPVATFSGESSKFTRQMQAESNPTHPATSAQRPVYAAYPLQGSPTSQHVDDVYQSTQYQLPQVYDRKPSVISSNHQIQQQQPLTNTYAIVHQKIPNNNYISYDVPATYQQQTEQNQGYSVKQSSDGHVPSHTQFVDSRPVEYIKISSLSGNSNQMDPPNHLQTENPQTYPENYQQTLKKDTSESSKNNQGYPLTKVQFVVPQYSSYQDGSQSGQYLNQQQGPYQVVNYDSKVRAPTQQPAQTVYPDPNSETYHPENRQVYLAPPQTYSSPVQNQQQQRQPQSEPNSANKYPTYSDSNAHYNQVPVTMQSEQLGIHIAIPSNY